MKVWPELVVCLFVVGFLVKDKPLWRSDFQKIWIIMLLSFKRTLMWGPKKAMAPHSSTLA